MEPDLAAAAVITLLAFLFPHHDTLPPAICKAILESCVRASSKEWSIWLVGGGAAVAARLTRSTKCAWYTIIFYGASMVSVKVWGETLHCAWPWWATFIFSLSFLIPILVSKVKTQLFSNPNTWTCTSCWLPNGVYITRCAHCHKPRP
eukprot:c2063_g1_i1 orf=191-634(-)